MPVTTKTGLVQRKPLRKRQVYPTVARAVHREPRLADTKLLGVHLNRAAVETA